ncbi:Urb2/Npa2 family-domain-containing protein [Chlamydoabsidia padenii]|nr:Urb2/Npa2 family-domain-containing protein [Chlamydoabsidia padenii]
MFTTMITKVLPNGLNVRRRLLESHATVSHQITQLLCHCFFHQDTILEYTSVLTAQNSKNASYVSKLFEELTKLITNGMEEDVLCILPTLLSHFIMAFRQKKHTTMAPTQEINRITEFGFFMQVHGIMEKGKPATMALKVEGMLLEQVLALNIYTARNDSVSKQQHEFLDSLAARAVDYLGDCQVFDQGFVMDILNYLLQIDITLIEHRMISIWPILLQPTGNSDSCLSLAQTVLKSYAASRQVDMFVAELLNAINTASFQDIYTVLRRPLFSKHFLQEFSSIVAKQVPAPQTLTIFELFTATLKINTEEAHPTKKAKRDNSHRSPPTAALLITTYLVEFIRSLRLGQHQRQAFERTAQELFDDFIRPSFNDKDDTHILPAIQAHFALSHTFYDVYWLKLSLTSREWLVLELKTLFDLEKHNDTQSSRLFLVHCANVLLQHVYFSTLQDDSFLSVKNSDLVNVVLERVMNEKDCAWQNVSWDGQLMSLANMDQVKLAIWKLVTDEWFDPICRVVQDDRKQAHSFASLVLLSTLKQQNDQDRLPDLTIQSLNRTLLRSANFFETKCFHDCSIDMLTDSIIQLFQHQDDNLAKEIIKIKQVDDDNKQDRINKLGKNLLDSLNHLMEQGDTNQEMVDMIARMMNMLLLFPLEYFIKQQRTLVLWLCFLVDAWLWSNGLAHPHSIIRGSLACRSLSLRLVNLTSAGVLQTSASILHWWVHVLDSRFTKEIFLLQPAETKAWIQVTKLMDYKVQMTILSMAGGKVPDANALTFLQDTLHHRFTTTNLKWTLNFMDALVDCLPTLLKKQENLDTSDVLGTIPVMDKMTTLITKTLGEDTHLIPTAKLAELFHGVTLVQQYARLLNQAGKDMNTTALSDVMINLVTPMLETLDVHAGSNDMAIHFAGAVSTTLSRQPDDETTKQINHVFWVVFATIQATNDKSAMESINSVFSKWIQSLAKQHYAVLVDHLADKLDIVEGRTLLPIMFLLLTRTNEGQKYRLRPMIPRFMLRLTAMVGATTQIKQLDDILNLLIRLTNETIFINNNYDASLVLTCLLQVLQPNTQSILLPQMDRQLTQVLFGKVCHVLVNLARLHRDALSSTMGPLVAILQTLLQSFKSAHLSLVNTKKRKSTTTAATTTMTTTLLTAHAPLDQDCADRYARICTQLIAKVAGGTQRSDMVQQNVQKHIPFILMAYFAGQSDPVSTITQPALKSALAAAWHELLETCSSTDRSLIMAGLNPTGQALFKSFYGTWKAEHKYTGQ